MVESSRVLTWSQAVRQPEEQPNLSRLSSHIPRLSSDLPVSPKMKTSKSSPSVASPWAEVEVAEERRLDEIEGGSAFGEAFPLVA